MPFQFRRPTLEDAAMIMAWRCRPEITRFMYTDIVPDAQRQRDWLCACENRADFRHFIIEQDGRPTGYLSYSEIDRTHRRCASGSYMVDAPKSAGLLYPFIFDYCFFKMNMHKLVNSFMAGNDKVIRIQRALKFREVGTFKEHIFKSGRWHDVTVFEMRREDWEKQPSPFARETTLAAFKE